MKRIVRSLMLTMLLLVVVAALASAGATWSGVSGPSWNGTNWVITGSATLTSPHTAAVCVGVDTPNDVEVAVVCSGTSTFTCTITGASVASEPAGGIAWRLYASNQSDCSLTSGNRTDGTPAQNGTFASGGTGPTAVALSSFDAARRDAGWQMAAIALLGLLGLGGGWWWARSRRQPLAG